MRSIAALLLALQAMLARAAGIDFPDNGAEAAGRAGAYAASAADPTAIYYNPAGLAKQKSFFFLLDGRLSHNPVSFQRTDAAGNTFQVNEAGEAVHSWDEVQNSAPPFPAPFVVAGYRPGVWEGRLALALGVYGPSSIGKRQFPDPRTCCVTADGATDMALVPRRAPNRYLFVESDTKIVFPTLALAARLTDSLLLGASLQSGVAMVKNVNAVYSFVGPRSTPDQADYDAIVTLDVTDWSALTAVVGALWAPLPWLEVGASFRPPVTFTGEGTMTVDLSPALRPLAEVKGEKARLTLKLPAVARLGARWQSERQGAWDVEVDLVWEGWGRLDEILVEPQGVQTVIKAPPPERTVALGAIHVPKGYQDAFSLRVGGDYALGWFLGFDAVARAGLFLESSAVPVERTSIDFPNYARSGASVGFSAPLGPLRLTFGYAHIFESVVKVTESAITESVTDKETQTAYCAGGGEGPRMACQVVGNGIFKSSYDLFSLAVSGQWGGAE